MIDEKVKTRILKRIVTGKYTLDEISAEFGVSKGAIHKWRTGASSKVAPLKKYKKRKNKITTLIDVVTKLCIGMDVPLDEFSEQLSRFAKL